MARILVVDDDQGIRKYLTKCLSGADHMLMVAESLADAKALRAVAEFDLIYLDVNLPDGSGLASINDFKNAASEPEVIIVTGEGKAEAAKMAFEHGAWDYILKPFTCHEIKLAAERALELRASKKALSLSSEAAFDRSDIIGSSPRLKMSLNLAVQCARSDASVLITGETGTGKELMAQTIHKNSSRKNSSFVVVDCAALPEQLVESVLFGNIKGAFTGADANRDGLVKKADGGTLFLDEIGELPLSIQKKFLRVLQEKKFKPVGGVTDIQSNFRLISATNRDLVSMLEKQWFRSDLLYRIRTFHVELPSLRQCKDDIIDLATYYTHQLCDRNGLEIKGLASEFIRALERYDWPGNIREFVNTMEKIILANPEVPTLYPNYLPVQLRLAALEPVIDKGSDVHAIPADGNGNGDAGTERSIHLPDELFHPIKPLKQIKDYITSAAERIYLVELLNVSENNLDSASKLSSISKSHLYALLKKYNLNRYD